MAPQIDVFQNLVISNLRQNGSEVHVELVDCDGADQWISFRFVDMVAAQEQAQLMEHWQFRETSLTYVRGDGHGALIDDAAFFRAAMDDDTSSRS
jgi:hypothetical protein